MFPEAAKFAYANKTKESITSQKLGSRDFWQIPNSILNKAKSAIPPLFNDPEVLSSAPDKSKLRTPILMTQVSTFLLTNLKIHNTSLTLKIVKKVITNFDASKTSGLDCIPVMVLKNCEPELSFTLAELFAKYLEKSCFPDCWKVSLVVPVFMNVGERFNAKNYCPISLIFKVSKVF